MHESQRKRSLRMQGGNKEVRNPGAVMYLIAVTLGASTSNRTAANVAALFLYPEPEPRPENAGGRYLDCRMVNGLMARENLSNFGLDDKIDYEASQRAQEVSSPSCICSPASLMRSRRPALVTHLERTRAPCNAATRQSGLRAGIRCGAQQ